MNYADRIAQEINVKSSQVAAAIELFDEGNTIPFVARYRKERTGSLDEEQLRQIVERLAHWRGLDERRAAVLASIEEQGKLTAELKEAIEAAVTMTTIEDLYAPYKPKRRTRAGIAREKGLQGLADLILQQPLTQQSMEELAKPYINDAVPDSESAWSGARDIVAETIAETAEVRQAVRQKALTWGILHCEKTSGGEDPRQVYQLYYLLEIRVDRLRPHQVLAMNRGEKEGVLRIWLDVPEQDWRGAITAVYRPNRKSLLAEQLDLAVADCAERLLLPAIERDVRRTLTEPAEKHAIEVFSANVRAALTQPPLAGYTVLGIDPGFRTGSKVAVVDPTGKLLATDTIYPHEPQKRWNEALDTLQKLVKKFGVRLIVLGNGTASRETEQLAAELAHREAGLRYLITNEAGASVYSASPLARAEFPDLDVSIRGAVSIARRVQDPLAELVKIDPKSIGVGLYQHDVDQSELSLTLDGVVEDVVNAVGVDVNTASAALLAHVSGIGPKLAEKIVAFRDENGPFNDRNQLRQVSGLGPKAFEQSAGFLRIRGGRNVLDESAIHPESYPIAEAVLKKAGIPLSTAVEARKEPLERLQKQLPVEKFAAELGCGVPTLKDIFDQLVRPGRDPRSDLPAPILRSDVLKMEDLTEGMRLKGTVRNVVDFGAFVDIGVKHDGLLHRSQIPAGLGIKLGDIIDVVVIKIELDRDRIALGWAG